MISINIDDDIDNVSDDIGDIDAVIDQSYGGELLVACTFVF